MDWTSIKDWLLQTVTGSIILGALGSFLFWSILNLIGKTNKRVKSLWIFYKEGRKKLFNTLIENDLEFEWYKYKASSSRFNTLIFPILAILGYVLAIFTELFNQEDVFETNTTVILVKIGYTISSIIFVLTLLLDTISHSMIRKVYKAKIKAQTKEEEPQPTPKKRHL